MGDSGNTTSPSESATNGKMQQEEIPKRATNVSANTPEIQRPVRFRQHTDGLERDDWKADNKSVATSSSKRSEGSNEIRKTVCYRQHTIGLERDDWKIDETAEIVRKAKASQGTKECKMVAAFKKGLSSEGIELAKKLQKTNIFKQWVKTFRKEDSRFPVLFTFMDVCKEKPTLKQRFRAWASSFRRCDPRYQILKFFNDVAQEGADNIWKLEDSLHAYPKIFNIFNRASVFTVWRPCHLEAIRKMMLGQGVGKGLDIKGKSAKRGKLSGFVPFMQIYREEHKRLVRTLPRGGTVRVFFSTFEAREMVVNKLKPIAEEMVAAVAEARAVVANEDAIVADANKEETAFRHLSWDMEDPNMYMVDDYAPKSFGLEIPERLFWEGYVVRQDCGREEGCQYDTGRPSEPAFQDMNFAALRQPPKDGAPKTVLFQYAETEHSMCPRNLLMSYEEQGRVMPVVSDFDCFLTGTRRVTFECDLSPDQLHLLKWCVDQMETILDTPRNNDTWTDRWLEVRKKEALRGFYPECPRFGFGDFTSYSIMQRACGRLQESGCVRHGAECFNYYFPQELDEEFLVISDTLPGNIHWKYMKVTELQEFLCSRIDDGFTMPLNPKWVLCDPGWKRVYDRLVLSPKENIKHSMEVWFPTDSGVREKIESIHSKHPNGFQMTLSKLVKRFSLLETAIGPGYSLSGTAAMDLGELELKHHVKLQRAKRKLRRAVSIMNFQKEVTKNKELQKLKLERANTEVLLDGTEEEKHEASQRVTAGLRATLFFIKLRRDLSTSDPTIGSVDTSDAVACHGPKHNKTAEELDHISNIWLKGSGSEPPITSDESSMGPKALLSGGNAEIDTKEGLTEQHTSETTLELPPRDRDMTHLSPLCEAAEEEFS